MAADARLTALADQLVTLFNRKAMDLPDGLFDRHTQFLLNGVPFEEMLGRSPKDPLVLMIARGSAGYRFAAKALQHAVPDARVERGEIEAVADDPAAFVLPLWLSGRLRGVDQPIEVVMRVTVRMAASGAVARADLALDEAHVARLRQARLTE